MKKFTVLILLVLAISLAQAQTYNQFKPANGILVGQTTTYVTTPAASSNVISLWSGTCNASSFLRGDGACQTAVTAPGGANTQVQFNNSGVFGGDAGLTYNAATDTLTSGIYTAVTGVIAPALSAPAALSLSSTGANSLSLSTNGNTRLSIGSGGDWLVGGTVGTNVQFLRSNGAGASPSWVTLDTSNFALLDSQNSFFFSSASNGGQSFANTSTATNASNELDVANSANALQLGITSTLFSGAKLTNGPSGQSVFINTNAAVPIAIGTNNSTRMTFDTNIVSSPIQIKSTKVFATGNLINYGLLVDSTDPAIGFRETDATTNNGLWDIVVAGEAMSFRALGDGALSPTTWLSINRTTSTVQTVAVTSNFFTFNGNAVLTQTTQLANVATSGCVSNPTAAMRFSLVGNVANVRINLASCTSNATTYAIPGAIPASYRPTVAGQECTISITDNSTRNVGYMVVETNGDINFYTNTSTGAWTASGTKDVGNIANVTCSWNIN